MVGVWREWILPRLVDRALSTDEVNARRRLACEGLRGRVLELGFGSGLNARYYPESVTEVLAVEPSDLAWRLAQPRVERLGKPVQRAARNSERLDLADDSVDSALSTYTLCTIPDVHAALLEVRRVLRPGGRLHFAEHGLAPEPSVQRWQRRIHPVHSRLAGGCHLDRPIDELIVDAGFTLAEIDRDYGTGLRWSSYIYRGRAVPQ
jgi:ubiquinone/menaquinone biosynthesis C-methylase UbiE